LLLAVALSPPAEALAEARFSWHMLQHLALTLGVAPLAALARPGELALQLLPVPVARHIARTMRPVRALGTGPGALLAWSAAAVVLWAWHVPALYAAALRAPAVHALEHGTLLVASVAWWSVLVHAGERRGIPLPASVPFCFATALHAGALGALITFAPVLLYPQAAAPDPLADQQLAGMLLWIPGGIAHVVPALVLLMRWMGGRRAEART
jgi:putative membrane protein